MASPDVPKNAELRRLAESDIPVLAFRFTRLKEREWAPSHSHPRGQLFALTKGLLVIETAGARWMFPSGHCAWIPPGFVHRARSFGGASGSMLFLSPELCRHLPAEPSIPTGSELLFALINRIHGWNNAPPGSAPQCRLLKVLEDEVRTAASHPLRLPVPGRPSLARVAHALLSNVARRRTLDEWASEAGMSRRTFMRAFTAEMGMSFGRWRQMARLFCALELLAQGESATNAAFTVGYANVRAFTAAFRTAFGQTPMKYFAKAGGRS
ncbi:MAG: helix-turn-helix transcriptional regulator [Acidobacteriota bacterium]|nr:helix-turn-helix transcriptional regulator [Acidobacteriota bacterium]